MKLEEKLEEKLENSDIVLMILDLTIGIRAIFSAVVLIGILVAAIVLF